MFRALTTKVFSSMVHKHIPSHEFLLEFVFHLCLGRPYVPVFQRHFPEGMACQKLMY